MKKLKLEMKDIRDVLSREQMRKIHGGYDGRPKCDCNNGNDCSGENIDCMADCEGGEGAGHCAWNGQG